jgi:diguanylate cyclase (GGDEF)-like protein
VSEHLAQALEQCSDWQAALAAYKRFHELHLRVSTENAQRSARVAAVRLGTERSKARADMLMRRNEHLQRRTEDLQRLSGEDPLTGLANRRRLEELLRADPQAFCVALIDVDHFKRVNDDCSHAVGDAVLRRLADLLRQGCRDADVPVRLGGEEFVALLRRVSPAAAHAAAERLRLLVAGHDWGSIAPGLSITVSIGVAHGDEASDGDALLALADRRLYIAKRGGRNRVVWTG